MRTDSGVTLVELLVALTLTGMVLAAAFSLLHQQGVAFTSGTDHAHLVQNHRYVTTIVERDLRLAGLGATGAQPGVIYGSESALAFNANHTSNDPDDIYATYIDRDAPEDAVTAARLANQFAIPTSNFQYPDADYTGMDGVLSNAETITLFFRDDTEVDDGSFVLYRQVNHLEADVVARGLRPHPTRPFFEYFASPAGQGPQQISTLPFTFEDEDAQGDRIAEQVRMVRINFEAVGPSTPDAPAIVRTVSRSVVLPNTGLRQTIRCGGAPAPAEQLSIQLQSQDPDTCVAQIRVRWHPSADETDQGQQDVQRYAIWTAPDGEPFRSAPWRSFPPGTVEGQAFYQEMVPTELAGTRFHIRVGVQDCTPSWSFADGDVLLPACTPTQEEGEGEEP